MFAVLNRISLPLVVKELLEQAARRRTYIIRVAYASLFFLACLLIILSEMPPGGSSPFGVLGIGRTMFISIAGWQFAGIYLFLPAMACNVLTVEKERNTLGLLFLTKLGPWTIIIEKLMSRLLPMYCLILCSLPLLAFSMSFGGVNTVDFFIAVWFLSLTAFQICAIAVACSSVFRTTTGALLMCYLVMFLMGFGMLIADYLIFNQSISYWLRNNPWFSSQDEELVLLSFVGFVGFIFQVEGVMPVTGPWQVLSFNLAMAVPLVGSGLVSLLIGRICLYRRAFIPATNPVLQILKSVDGTFQKLNNNRVTRGIVVLKEASGDPGFSPIAWRETQKRSLGQTRYLVRILLALEVPVLLTICGVVIQTRDADAGGVALSITTMLVWLVVTLLITVTSAGLISGERGRQTLEILLALPMSGRQIILDKLAGVRRVAFVCALPLLTCITFQTWWVETAGTYRARSYGESHLWWNYYFTKLSMVAIYIPLLIWLGLWIGLKIKSPTRATSAALITVAAWCVLPLIMVSTVWALLTTGDVISHIGLLLQTSPAFLLFYTEYGSLHRLASLPLLPMLVNLLIYGSCTLVLRSWVLSYADQLLGRTLPRKKVILRNDWDNDSEDFAPVTTAAQQ